MIKRVLLPIFSIELKLFATILILLFFLFPLKSFPFYPQPDSAPSFLSAVSDQDGKVPLYWFKPGIEPQLQLYDDGTEENQLYVSEEWHENCFAQKFVSPPLPFVLLKSVVFISYQGKAGDPFYDPTDPFLITINKNNQGIPGEMFSQPVYVNASGNAHTDGEWVEIEHNLLITDEDTFWVVFHWLEETPISPLIGADNSTTSEMSFAGWKKDGYWQWWQWNYNWMIRCLTLSNDSPTCLSPDGYNLYRADSSGFPVLPEFLLDTFSADSFYYPDTQVTNGETYFYKLTAVYSGQESKSSDQACATPRQGALLQVELDSLEILLTSGEQREEHTNLTNAGDLPLDYKTELELLPDDSIKGTDTYGYTWSDNITQKSLKYEWVDISERGTLINQPGDKNEVYGPLYLSFPFPLYGNLYDSLWISTNGVLSFYPWDLKFVNQPLPYSQGYFRLISPFWSNLVLTDSSRIYLFDSDDSLIVSFEKIKHFKYDDLYTFQVILTKEGSIDLQYEETGQHNDTATVGIQNQDGTCALLVSYNQDYLKDSLRVRINPSWLLISPLQGEIDPGENQSVNLFFDSYFLPIGSYRGNLKIYSWDKNHNLPPVSIPVILNVDTTTSVGEEKESLPYAFTLSQNYPNPFNPATTIPFQVRSLEFGVCGPIHTTLTIYNILGQKVRTLLDEKKLPGSYQIIWDGKDEKGNQASSGIYFYQLKVKDYKETRKMNLLK